jgi:hypothetical protein
MSSVFDSFVSYSPGLVSGGGENHQQQLIRWSWLVLGQPSLSAVDDSSYLIRNISMCLSLNTFFKISVELRGSAPFPIFKPSTYGAHSEWNGDYDNPLPTCVAGYEELSIKTSVFGLGTHCFPCLNGTARSQHSESKTCSLCTEINTHAPYLGMEKCTCLPGYEYIDGACAFVVSDFFYPWWYVNNPLAPSLAAASFCVLAIFFALAAVWLS